MPVETHVDQARRRVRAEREAVDAKLDAIETFVDRVTDLPTERTQSSAPRVTATAGVQPGADPSGDGCRAVRTAFDETVRPHVLDDDSTLFEAIRTEFSDRVAAALAPTTEPSFSSGLKRLVVAEARTSRAETEVLRRALDREDAHTENAGETVDEITAWIADADETPLSALGFEELRDRHGTLAAHRDRCDELARERQAFLRTATSEAGEVGVRHRSLLPSLYGDFPVDHPVLATVARLDAACAECQRAVRDHLVRRV